MSKRKRSRVSRREFFLNSAKTVAGISAATFVSHVEAHNPTAVNLLSPGGSLGDSREINSIVKENQRTINVVNFRDLINHKHTSIEGFPGEISVNRGDSIGFKVNCNQPHHIDIYRLGYYAGMGARKVDEIRSLKASTQPGCEPDPKNENLIDCQKWAATASWTVSEDMVSGIYLAHLVAENGSMNHFLFVVRDDMAKSDLLFKTSDPTWQAYNRYRNYCFYPPIGAGGERVRKVSYNRPVMPNDYEVTSDDYFFSSEFRMLRWLERNGYNVKYTSAVDVARSKHDNHRNILLDKSGKKKIRILLSVGHDEYWSAEERSCFETARNVGVNLCFFSGNECYWKTRWEDNYQTLVCYKEGTDGANSCGTKCDPNPEWTGLWRNPEGKNYGGGLPESKLTGQLSVAPIDPSHGWSINVPHTYKDHDFYAHRFWRYTDVAELRKNEIVALLPSGHDEGILGYEWDFQQQDSSLYPPTREILSYVEINHVGKKYVHHLSLYQHMNNNRTTLVFGAGTTRWSWGLDNLNTGDAPLLFESSPGNQATDRNVQQATANLLYEMGALPYSLQTNLRYPKP